MNAKTTRNVNLEIVNPDNIKHITRDLIDTRKWDTCISQSVNESPVAYSWVLDYLSPGWEGLIIGDYDGVMPLTVSKNTGPRMLQMPVDIQNFGIFSSQPAIVKLKSDIFKHPAFKKFHYINYNFMPEDERHTNEKPGCQTRNTFELNLNFDYHTLFNNYAKSHGKNIRRFSRNHLLIEKNKYPLAYKQLQQEKAKEKPVLFSPPRHNNNFNNMVKEALERGKGEMFSISLDQTIIGAAFYLIGVRRTVVFHINNAQGRRLKTTFGLIDHFIKTNAGKNIILDFAGSEIENIAGFNRGFGASQKYYENVEVNNLPVLLKFMKKFNIRYRLKRFISQKSRKTELSL